MKRILRSDWHVQTAISPDRLSEAILGDLPGYLTGPRIELNVDPRRLGDLGVISMPDSMASRDVEGAYQRRCEEIRLGLLAKPYVVEARVLWNETAVCSHCGMAWEELTAELLKEHPDWAEEPGDGPGLPLCCEKAQAEWRSQSLTTRWVEEHGDPAEWSAETRAEYAQALAATGGAVTR